MEPVKPSSYMQCNVLLVEDCVDSVALAKAYLNDPRISLVVAANGRDAVQAFKDGSFDLVFMDILMPVLDGYAATTAIRRWEAEEKRAPTPVIALTASSSTAALGRIFASGCTQYLPKPISRTGLLQTARQFTPRQAAPPNDAIKD